MIEVKQIFNKEEYLNLILEADPDEEIVNEYIHNSDMYGIFEAEKIMAEIIITKVDNKTCELKNIATVEQARGRGYGKKLVKQIAQMYSNKYEKMIVGTTQNNIPFYVKAGFDKYYKTEYNFFVKKHKDEIFDGDLHCIDMYFYYMDLKKSNNKYEIIEINNNMRNRVNEYLINEWESTNIIVRGKIIDGTKLEGFVVLNNGNNIIGLITYLIYDNNEMEIISLNSNIEGIGIGKKLIDKVKEIAIKKDCKLIKLVTTNDNVEALKFYQKRGFVISNIYINAMEKSRKLKPEIP
ncbi:MAG: GNAT family N-acetyltransferase, partial [Clostridia bacterium]|nr:GNAT family N-acetyltransferase [Clostridia bacterium]